MKVNIEDVLRIKRERARINSVPLSEIEWYKDGKKLDVYPGDIQDFTFTGLSNIDFIDEKGHTFEWDKK